MLYPRASTNLNNNAFDWLKNEASKCNINLTIAFFEDCSLNYPSNRLLINKIEAPKPDCVILRGYNAAISTHFENQGTWVLNPWQAMHASQNKVLTHQILHKNNIPNPPIIYSTSANYNFTEICAAFDDKKFIVKKTDGSKGENVFLVTSPTELAQAIKSCAHNCLCQKYIASSHGRDIRIWVIGNKIAGGVERHNPNSFLSNFSQGGHASLITIPQAAAQLAIDSSQVLGLEFCGVDILYGQNNSYTVCEVNGNAGFRTISQYSQNPENNIPAQLFNYISTQLQLKPAKN